MALHDPTQLTISRDLYRAIEELRSVPVLQGIDELTFADDDINVRVPSAAVDRGRYAASRSRTNAENVVKIVNTESINRVATSTTTSIVSTSITSKRYCDIQKADLKDEHTVSSVCGTDLAKMPLIRVEKRVAVNVGDIPIVPDGTTQRGSAPTDRGTVISDNDDRLGSDNVFVDVPVPISPDLLIDDVYEREMDELDLLEVTDDFSSISIESTATECFDQRIEQTTEGHTNGLLFESTEGRYMCSNNCSSERNQGNSFQKDTGDLATHPRPFTANESFTASPRLTASSSADTSIEELFEEIVESMRNSDSEGDAEMNSLIDEDSQLDVDAPNLEELEMLTSHRSSVDEKFVNSSSSAADKLDSLSASADDTPWKDAARQRQLTDSLSTTLNDCLNALSRINAVSYHRGTPSSLRAKEFTAAEREIVSPKPKSSTRKSSQDEGRQCVTSSSSGFQSDILDVNIDHEFDVNMNAMLDDAADTLLRSPTSAAESLSLDSLLEWNTIDSSNSADTAVIRRTARISPASSDSHSVDHCSVNGFVENSSTLRRNVIETGRDAVTAPRDVKVADDGDEKNSRVVSYDDREPKVEVLAEELITQEIVLNIIRPRRLKKPNKQEETVGCQSADDKVVVERRQANKMPQRHTHIHRVICASDISDDSRRALQHQSMDAQDSETAGVTVNGLTSLAFQSTLSAGEGRPVSVELEQHAESATTEPLSDYSRLKVTRRDCVKVLRAPDGSGLALFNMPVAGLSQVVDDVSRTFVDSHRQHPLPSGVRVTCNAVQRKSASSRAGSDVTVLRRLITDSSDDARPVLRTATLQ